MALIMIGMKMKKSELDAEVPNAIQQINDWFAANPTRKTCRTQLWYGQAHTIERGIGPECAAM